MEFSIDNYASERASRGSWRGIEIVNWHRPLSSYMDAFLAGDLVLRRFLEPLPSREALRQRPKLADYFRVPYFLQLVCDPLNFFGATDPI